MNILVVGSLAYDYFVTIEGSFVDHINEDTFPRISAYFSANAFNKYYGGTAGNIAYTLALLGEHPMIVADAGNDSQEYKEFLEKHQVSTRYIAEDSNTPTNVYIALIDKKNNYIGSFYDGGKTNKRTIAFKSIKEKASFAVIAPTRPSLMNDAVDFCIAKNIPYLYTPSFLTKTIEKNDLMRGVKHASLLIGNDREMQTLEETLDVFHDDLVSSVPIVITTLGEHGSIIETAKDRMHIPAAKTKRVLDTRGAGDAYIAGFIAGYIRSYPLDVCGNMGSIAASYAIESHGTQTHAFTKDSFTKRYQEQYHATVSL